jgi:hypothetical protein
MNNETPTPRTDKVVSDDMGDSRFIIDLIKHAQQLERELNEAKGGVCEWKYDDLHNYYDAVCSFAFCFTEGTPEDNKYRYCPGCGKKIKIV